MECLCGCGTTVGGTFAPGHALRYVTQLRRRALDGDVAARAEMYERGWTMTPKQRLSTRAFGFEAEFFGIEQYDAVDALEGAGFDVKDDGYHHHTRPFWRITEDGSVSGSGCELVSPILRSNLKPDIDASRLAVTVLSQAGGQVNRTCGLHIHHNLTGKTVNDVAETVGHWALFQPIINRILPQSRWDGEYCAGMDNPRTWALDVVCYGGDPGGRATNIDGRRFGRYHAINLNAIQDHGTLEYRQHGGTLNPSKVEHCVKFTRAMHDVSRIGRWTMLIDIFGTQFAVVDGLGVRGMMDYLNVGKATTDFYVAREAQLADFGLDDEGADDDVNDSEPDYEDEFGEGEWCSECREYHYE